MTPKQWSQVEFMFESFSNLDDRIVEMRDLLNLLNDPETDAYDAMAQAAKLEDVSAIVKAKTATIHTLRLHSRPNSARKRVSRPTIRRPNSSRAWE